jgi:DHA2 family multidrug resistance protein
MAVTLPRPAGLTLPLPRPLPFPIPAAPATRRHILPSRDALVEHGARLATVVTVACVAIFLDASTSYESSTALPYIQGAVGATADEASWLVTLFNAAYETATLLSPWFLTRFGRRRYFVGSLVGYAVFSLACAASPTYEFFLVARLLQGFALGGFFACGVLSLFMSIPDRLRLVGIMLFSMSSQLGSAIGPAVAGYLVYNDAWQWVFVLSALPALVLAFGIGRILKDPVRPQRVPFDVVGALLIVVTFLCLQYVVNEGERRNWTEDPWVTLALCIAPLGGAAMLYWVLRVSPHPFLDFRVLRHRNLVVGAVFGFGFGVMLQAATSIGAFVEKTLDFTPTLGGGTDALRAIAIVVFVPIVTFAMAEKWLGVRTALLLGLGIAFAGFRFEVTATTTDSDFTSFILPMAGIGIGIAILYRALATVIFGTLPKEDLIMGLLVYKLSGLLGGALAVPFFTTMLDHRFDAVSTALAGGVNLASAPVRTYLGHGGNAATLGHIVQAQATAIAYSDLWSTASLVVLALLSAILLLDVRSPAPAAD